MNDDVVGREEERGLGQLLGPPEPAHRDVHHPARPPIGIRDQLLEQRRFDRARGTASSRGCPGARTRPRSRGSSTSTPPLLDVYAICAVAAPMSATNDATFTIEPPPDSSIAGIPALHPSQTPFEVDVHHLAPRRLGRVEHATVVGGEDAGVVVEHVQRAEACPSRPRPSPRRRPARPRWPARTRPRRPPRCDGGDRVVAGASRRSRRRRCAHLRRRRAPRRTGPSRCPRR